jgi:HPt (histidine-containing phosphotransfer) domain-containing protein
MTPNLPDDDRSLEDWQSRVDPELRELIPGFLETLGEETEQLSVYMESGDYSALARIGHNYKGSAEYFGLTELGSLARALEVSSKARDLPTISSITGLWKKLVLELQPLSER